MAIYGYIRVADDNSDLCKAEAVQREILRVYAELHNLVIDEYFVERSYASSTPLRLRFEGRRLLACLQAGDCVIASTLDRVFGSTEDAQQTLRQLQDRNVVFILTDFGGAVTEPHVMQIVTRVLAQAA